MNNLKLLKSVTHFPYTDREKKLVEETNKSGGIMYTKSELFQRIIQVLDEQNKRIEELEKQLNKITYEFHR